MKHLQKLGYTALGAILALTVASTVPAIAAQIQTITATLNSVNIEVNGQKVAVSGENYTLDNGKQTAGSIVYNETTYVPIRKFGEIMGAEIGYDGATGSVTVKGEVKAPTEPEPTGGPDTVAGDKATLKSLIGYEIKAFDGMFSIARFSVSTDVAPTYTVLYTGNLNEEDFLKYWSTLSQEYTDTQTDALVKEMRALNIESGYMDLNFGYGEKGRILLADFRIYQDKTGTANIYNPPMRF